MTYQGARAPDSTTIDSRLFAISKVGFDSTGRIARVLWGEINRATNLPVGDSVAATLGDVVDALHAGHRVVAHFPASPAQRPERAFVAVEHADGHETIAFEGPATTEREIANIALLTP